MPPEMRPIQESLDYFGVRAETHDGVTRIHVPPLPGVRHLSRGYWWVLYPLALATGLGVGAVRSSFAGSGDAPALAFPAIMYLAITLIVVALALQRLRRYVILQVGADELRLLHVRHGTPREVHHWRRSQLSDIHVNRSNGKLWMRVEGTDPVEVVLTPSMSVNQWISDRVNASLNAVASGTQQDVSLSYASALNLETSATKSKLIRRILLGTSLAMTALGIAALFTPIGPVGCYLVLLAGAPAGIALGTQKKEFFM